MTVTNTVRSETPASYSKTATCNTEKKIAQAIKLLSASLNQPGEALTSPQKVRQLLQLKFAGKHIETFNILWLDNQHRVLELQTLFTGTINAANVYPREVVKAALDINAAACIISHNHPSGFAAPSDADKAITKRLIKCLECIDVRVLDHIIIGGDCNLETFSFAEAGLI